MNLKDYKLALFDMDDTLCYEGNISQANKDALEKLHQAGVKVGYCTGRSLPMIQPELGYDWLDFAICSSGACVYDVKNKKTIYEVFFPKECAKEVVKLLKKNTFGQLVLSHDTYFSFATVVKSRLKQGNIYLLAKKVKKIFTYLKHFFSNPLDYYLKGGEVTKMCVFFRSNRKRDEVENILNEKYHFHTVSMATNYLEISPEGVSKSNGVRIACDYLGIDISQVMAFGDSENDLDMLEACGYAVAMGNAVKQVKDICNITIGSCKEDGIAKFINENI